MTKIYRFSKCITAIEKIAQGFAWIINWQAHPFSKKRQAV